MKKFIDYDFADEITSKCIQTHLLDKKGYIKRKTIVNDKYDLKDKNGVYLSFELKKNIDESLLVKDIIQELKKMIKEKCPKKKPCILCYGIGNEYYSSDALGPKTIKKINPTLHQKNKNEYGLCALIPGVMGNTGLESARIARGLIKEYKIDLIIVIDSLITHDENRIFKIIQMTDAGLTPGSGLNNNRKELSKKYLNIPVIALGVATAFPLISIKHNLIKKLETNLNMKIPYSHFNEEICYFTPKDSEEEIEYFSTLIANAINNCI